MSMTDFEVNIDYGDVIAGALTADPSWAEPLRQGLVGRLMMTALFGESLRASADARHRGTTLVLFEWPFLEKFQMQANGRIVTFDRKRGEAAIQIERLGFPGSLVPWDAHNETVPIPADVHQIQGLAREQVIQAVRLLFAPV